MVLSVLEGGEDETCSENTNYRMSDLYRKSKSVVFNLSTKKKVRGLHTRSSNVPPQSKTAMIRGAFVPS
jgi:hypothetical protein